MGNEYLSLFKNIPKEKRSVAQSECLKQIPTKIKNLYNDFYIGKEKEFIELLLYIKEKNGKDQIM
ncbi:hypothetical protein SAMN05216352_103379 [Alteribacillus bidgolensis]|uniref:Uncharacterized protein n=1 Tax=Alteribacillus bidgolensis TaxID=930129 RepID=A0A1G8GFW6_9BACI|nr:hypothetical protein SAMN05216352_103379 [Alteribacillus bidgolensis]